MLINSHQKTDVCTADFFLRWSGPSIAKYRCDFLGGKSTGEFEWDEIPLEKYFFFNSSTKCS